MPSQHRKHRGFRTERVVAEYLSRYWSGATVGRGNGKDIINVPFDAEVKARGDSNFLEWLRQGRRRAEKTGELSFVVSRRNGQGEDAAEYLAFMRFGDLVELLIRAGYADIQQDTVNLEPTDCTKCGALTIKGSVCRTCKVIANANL